WMGLLEGLNIAAPIPVLRAVGEAMLQYQRRAFPFDLVMNVNPLIISIWHRCFLLTVTPPVPGASRLADLSLHVSFYLPYQIFRGGEGGPLRRIKDWRHQRCAIDRMARDHYGNPIDLGQTVWGEDGLRRTAGYDCPVYQEGYTSGTEGRMIQIVQRHHHSQAVTLGEALEQG